MAVANLTVTRQPTASDRTSAIGVAGSTKGES